VCCQTQRADLESSTWAEVQCKTLDSGSSVVVISDPSVAQEVATMNAQECLKRTAECTRLAEATNDPGLRKYLTKLASSWMEATITAERNECVTPDGPRRRRLKMVHDLFC
jgi:hypothetical protein